MVKRNTKLSSIFSKNILKKLSACIIATSMVMSGMLVNIGINEKFEIEKVYASETLTYTEGNSTYHYEIKNDGTVRIRSYDGTDEEITIPSEINGIKVTDIGEYCFHDCENLKEVNIPNSVEYIGYNETNNRCYEHTVFQGCKSLENINVDGENKLYTSIDGNLIKQKEEHEITDAYGTRVEWYDINRLVVCPAGKSGVYSVPEGVMELNVYALDECKNITEINLPASLKKISYSGLPSRNIDFCSNLQKFNVNENNMYFVDVEGVLYSYDKSTLWRVPIKKSGIISLQSETKGILRDAFLGCDDITQININDNLSYIEDSKIYIGNNLESISVSEKNNFFESVDGILFSKGLEKLICCPAKRNTVSIPKDTIEVCCELKSSELESINVDEDNICYSAIDGVLYNKQKTALIVCPRKKTGTVIVPDTVEAINVPAFVGCTKIETVVLSGNIEYIMYLEGYESVSLGGLFEKCENLKFLYSSSEVPINRFFLFDCISENVTHGVYTIIDNNSISLEVVKSGTDFYSIPEEIAGYKVTEYKMTTNSIKNIYISKNVNNIYREYYTGLLNFDVSVDNSIYSSKDGVLFSKDGTELIMYPDGRTKNIYFVPNEVTKIGENAFKQCWDNEVVVFENIEQISENSFAGFSCLYGLKDTYVQNYAFNHYISFLTELSVKSEDNIIVIYPLENIREELVLVTKKIIESDEVFEKITNNMEINKEENKELKVEFEAYEIDFTDKNGEVIDLNGAVMIKIPFEIKNDNEYKVYKMEGDGEFVDMNANYNYGYMEFETENEGIYVLTDCELNKSYSGDTNGDGEIDIKDSALIKRYLAGADVELDLKAADVNGDGEVTIKDSALIKRKLAGWE